MQHGLNNDYIYAVSKIVLTISDGTNSITSHGTGFFIKKDSDLFFITNRHVVQPGWSDTQYSSYTKIQKIVIDRRIYDKSTKSTEVENMEVANYEISYPENDKDDIACIANIQVRNWSGKTPMNIAFSMLATSEQFENDLTICDNVVFIGFPIVYDHKHNMPILRGGVISSDPRLDYSFNGENNGHILAYEAFSTSGASGSPVFATQKGFQIGEGLKAPEGFYRPVLLIGINAGSITKSGEHQQMSYMFKSDQIIALIEKQAEKK